METERLTLSTVIWVLAGAGWGLVNWKLNNKTSGEEIDWNHLGTTVLEHAAAGFLLAFLGEEFTIENLEYYAMVVGPHLDKIVNTFVDTRSNPINEDATPNETENRSEMIPEDFDEFFSEIETSNEESSDRIRKGP